MKQCIILTLFLAVTVFGQDKLDIVTTTTDLADFARHIGNDRVSVVSLSTGDQDPHAVEPRPSMVMKVKKADLLIRVGMDLDLWVEGLIDASRNRTVMQGAKGYLDVSEVIEKLEVPEGTVDGSMGDIHIYGNPHYWTCPHNALLMVDRILSCMALLRPADAAYFTKNGAAYKQELSTKIESWKATLKPYAGSAIVTYHNSWPYFAQCFGLRLAGFVEPKPGIPPTPAHIAVLVDRMKRSKVTVIAMEPWFSRKTAESVAAKAGATVAVLPPSVGGVSGTGSYIGLMSHNVNVLAGILQKGSAR